MANRTLIRQATQVRSSDLYDDDIVPSEANFETLPQNIQDDLNALRSMVSELRDLRQGDWWQALAAATGIEPGPTRGVQSLNESLHLLEVKRWIREVSQVSTVSIPPGQNYVVLEEGDTPVQPLAAVGAVTSLGTVVALHTGVFGTHSLDQVAGSYLLSPANLVRIVKAGTRTSITSDGRQIWGLLQGETGLVDGSTISSSSPKRAQISFVRIDVSGSALEPVPATDIGNTSISYCFRERVRLKDLLEGDLLKGVEEEDASFVFSTHFYTATDDTETSDTDPSYQLKVRVTTGSIPAGTYIVTFQFQMRSSNNKPVYAQIQIDDVDVLSEIEVSDKYYRQQAGNGIRVLTAGVHTIDLSYCIGDGAPRTVFIKDARVHIWRVA